MKVACSLRVHRYLPLRETGARVGIAFGQLSMIERGRLLPTDEELARIEAVYGIDRTVIYPAEVLEVLDPDGIAA